MDLKDQWACEVEVSDKDDWNLDNSPLQNTGTEAPEDSCQTAASWDWNSVITPANIRLCFSPIPLSLPPFLSVTPGRKQLQICFRACVGGFLLALL